MIGKLFCANVGVTVHLMDMDTFMMTQPRPLYMGRIEIGAKEVKIKVSMPFICKFSVSKNQNNGIVKIIVNY